MRLRQILINLLSNANKFSEKGTIDLRPQIVVGGQERLILMSLIKDREFARRTSAGCSNRLVDLTMTAVAPRETGLGLNISRQLAQRLGGRYFG